MNIYILRHGQTNYNVEGKFQGQVDVELNETGIKQAYQTKQLLNNINFDVVISSPLKRAIKTAQIVTDKTDIKIDNRVIERSFGTLEGKLGIPDFEENLDLYKIEDYTSLCNRVYSFLNEIISSNSNASEILIVTHEGIAQIIETYFNKEMNISNWKSFRLNTGDYKKYVV